MKTRGLNWTWQASTWSLVTKLECGLESPLGSIGDRLPRLNVVFEFASGIKWEQAAEVNTALGQNQDRTRAGCRGWMRHWVEIMIEWKQAAEVECGFKLATEIYWRHAAKVECCFCLSWQPGSNESRLPLLEKLDQINKQSTDFCRLVHYNDRFNWFCNFFNRLTSIFLLIYVEQWPNQQNFVFWNLFGIFHNILESYRICK